VAAVNARGLFCVRCTWFAARSLVCVRCGVQSEPCPGACELVEELAVLLVLASEASELGI
jgi:hypothetical protein